MAAFFFICLLKFCKILLYFIYQINRQMKRLNKEYKLDVCNHINLKYGTVNRNNPQVIYVSGKCWISPLRKMDYSSVFNEIEKNMRKNIKTFLTDGVNFENKYILDFDINVDNLSPNEKKFLSFDFYLRQNDKNKKELSALKDVFNRKISTIANNLVYMFKENDFTVNKTKK